MYTKGLINELSQALIKRVAKRTVAKYQKTSDTATAKADKDERTQDAPSARVSSHAANRAEKKTSQKREQARRVLSKMKGHHAKGETYSGDADYKLSTNQKHGLSRQDMKGESGYYKTNQHRKNDQVSDR